MLFLLTPAAIFDLASFSFHVPMFASAASAAAAAPRHSARVSPIVLGLMSAPACIQAIRIVALTAGRNPPRKRGGIPHGIRPDSLLAVPSPACSRNRPAP